MALRFRFTMKLLPGVRLNLGLHGAGVSVGPRGLHVGVNRRGMYTVFPGRACMRCAVSAAPRGTIRTFREPLAASCWAF
jgi:hypothetical protein